MYLQDVEVLKDIPGYKALLKAVIKSQIQMLVEQLSEQAGEESIILTASSVDGSLSHLGSLSGKDFFDGRDELKTQFLSHILKKINQNGSSDAGGMAKKARYEESDEPIQTNLSFQDPDLSQPYDTAFPSQNQASNVLEDWEPPQSNFGNFETSTDKRGKMVVRKKRFKEVPSTKTVPSVVSVPNVQIQREVRSKEMPSVSMKPEGLNIGDNEVRDNVIDNSNHETEAAGNMPGVLDTELGLSQPSVKTEQDDDGDDDDDMAIIGVEPGRNQSGYQCSEMDSSYDQSFQEGDSFASPYAKAAFMNQVPFTAMNTREQEAFMMSVNAMYGYHSNQQHVEGLKNLNMISENMPPQKQAIDLGQNDALAKSKTKNQSETEIVTVVEKSQTGLELRKFSCLTCGKLFSQKSDVKRHQVVHTGQKFACSYCNKQFSQKHGRNLHEKAHRIEAAGILNI